MDKKQKFTFLMEHFSSSLNSQHLLPHNLGSIPGGFNMNDLSKLFGEECVIGKTSKLLAPYVELHHHDFYEILYIKKGSFKFTVDEKNYEINPGDMVLITPTTLHVLDNLTTADCERIIINFSDSFIDKLSSPNTDLKAVFKKVDKSKNYCISFRNEAQKRVENYLGILLDTQFSEKYGEDLLFKIKLIQLLLLINSTYENSEDLEIPVENHVISQAIEFINNNLDKSFIIDDIAAYANVSPSTMSHTFKDQTGISIYRYITKKRMVLAKKLIKENINFSQIYTMCGYNEYTSFFRAFKKEYGVTPKDFYNTYSSLTHK
ncbi:MAG: AraC family transcriptional regulator [Erysipelotrichaceae bacterium]|nr:AraC family transcriptional regulator [Erysipelotrichaceae bacterium]